MISFKTACRINARGRFFTGSRQVSKTEDQQNTMRGFYLQLDFDYSTAGSACKTDDESAGKDPLHETARRLDLAGLALGVQPVAHSLRTFVAPAHSAVRSNTPQSLARPFAFLS
jgi:hypothetical protein